MFDCMEPEIYTDEMIQKMIELFGYYSKDIELQLIWDKIDDKHRTPLTYNYLIKAYVNCKFYERSIRIFLSNINANMTNIETIITAINCCTIMKDRENGEYIHKKLIEFDINNRDITHELMQFYGNIGDVSRAEYLFENISDKDINSYNIMMNVYLMNECYHEVLNIFDLHELSSIKNTKTYELSIKACANIFDKNKGIKIHSEIGDDYIDINVDNALIMFYGNINDIDKAKEIYNNTDINSRDINTYNNMIYAYKLNKYYDDGINIFFMHELNDIRNDATCAYALNCATFVSDENKGDEIVKDINSQGRHTVLTKNAQIMYWGFKKDMDRVRRLYDDVKDTDKNIDTYNALMYAYNINAEYNRSHALFCSTEVQSLKNINSYIEGIKSCTDMDELNSIYNEILEIKSEYMTDESVAEALIETYSRLNNIDKAKEIFTEYIAKCMEYNLDGCLRLFTAMISGYNTVKDPQNGLELFTALKTGEYESFWKEIKDMFDDNNKIIKRNVGLLYLNLIKCFVENEFDHNAEKIYNEYKELFNHQYDLRIHCKIQASMVDILAQKGLLDEAHTIVKNSEQEIDILKKQDKIQLYTTLLAGCKKFSNDDMAEQIYRKINELNDDRRYNNSKHISEINRKNYENHMTSATILMSNIYGSIGDHEKEQYYRNIIKQNGWKKVPGWSKIEVNGKTHTFYAGHHSYRKQFPDEWRAIQRNLNVMMDTIEKEYGFQHIRAALTRKLWDGETLSQALRGHSEKVAITYLLMHAPPHQMLFIAKNLRVCLDCHAAFKLISKHIGREIRMTDNKIVHIFDGKGGCSCKDFY